jgi:hypothetical protein
MSGKLWMITPAVAFATAALLALMPPDAPQAAARAPANCVRLAAADTGVMSDATDACVFSVLKAAAEPGCSKSRSRTVMVAEGLKLTAAVARSRFDDRGGALAWPLDFIALTADAAAGVWDTTIGLLGDIYDFAERKASGLWI